MDRKVNVVAKSLLQLNELDSFVSGDVIANEKILAIHINKFVETLQAVYEEGRVMDDSSMFDLPKEFFDHVDQADSNNPEFFKLKMFGECNDKARILRERIAYLDNLKQNLTEELNQNGDENGSEKKND